MALNILYLADRRKFELFIKFLKAISSFLLGHGKGDKEAS
jgi:hypothetical protein